MRKASHDGGDSTSITSGIESETKKPGAGILKSTKNSIKRKVQHFSDDTANEPLLHKNKEISDIEKQSAKLLLSKTKTDYGCQKGDDKDKLLADDKIAQPSISDVTGVTHHGVLIGISNDLMEQKYSNSQSISTASIHNHMNTNVFGNMEGLRNSVAVKTQILVELDASKPTGYSPSPLIFTTAKIHTDGKMQQMEPVQVTSVPILSTIEGNTMKKETKTTECSDKPKSGEFIETTNKNFTERHSKEKKNITVTQLTTKIASLSKLPEKHEFNTTSSQNIIGSASNKPAQSISNFKRDNKDKDASTLKHTRSNVGNIQYKHAQLPDINKKSKDEIFSTKIPQLSHGSDDSLGSKVSSSTIKQTELAKFSKNNPILNKTDKTHKIPSTSSTIDKNCVDINKNVQVSSQRDLEERKTEKNQVSLEAVPSKLINDTNKIKEFVVSPGIKEELSKMNPCSISSNKTSKEDQKTADIKIPSKDVAQYIVSLSSEKSSSIIVTTTSHNVNKTTESNLSKATSPSTSYSNTNFNAIDKTPLTLLSKTISTTDSSKISSSVPVSNVTNTSTTEGKIVITEITGSNLGSANSRSTITNTASKFKTTGNSVITTSNASNDAATVVSSISKPTAIASGIKLPSCSTPSTGTEKSEPKTSGIPKISSSVKSTTANAVTSDKITANSSPVNNSISNNTKPASKTAKVSATNSSSINSSALTSTAKVPSTFSTKTATENVSHSHDKPI